MIPPRSILAAVDFSESSKTALAFAARLARHTGAALHVLHAEDPLLAAAAKSRGIDLTRETREELERFGAVACSPGTAPVQYHVAIGAAAAAICDVAAREQADLIVMGMHGMSGAVRAMFGSTTEGVLRQANRSVLVVPDSWTTPVAGSADLSGMGPVVAAVDQTEPAVASAAAAARLATLLNAPIELVHIVAELPVLDRWRGHAEAAVTQRMEQARGELAALVPSLGATTPVRVLVDSGRVAEALARVVAPGSGRRPLLVLGRRNRATRLGAPGATAYRLLTLAQVPVLVHLPEA